METLYKRLLEAYKKGQQNNETIENVDIPDKSTVEGFVSYPAITSSTFYDTLLNKKEFNDIAGNKAPQHYVYDDEVANRCSDVTFKIAPHQVFVKRFLSPQTPYNGLLLYHSVGVGKTCSAISIAEQYIGLYNKRVLVILSSTLKENFKKQIFDITKYNIEKNVANLCTGVKYPEMIVDRAMLKMDVFEKRINKLINERYQFMGYKELVEFMKRVQLRIQKNERDESKHEIRYREKLQEIFSDRLIIIDEAHNLRMPSETGKKQISSAFLELMQTVKNTKLLLMTATPMFNDPREIVWLINLLLTNDKRSLLKTSNMFDKNGGITKQGEKILSDACKGYVSHMRGENPFSFPFRLYPSDDNVIKTFPSKDTKGAAIPKEHKIHNLILIGSELSPKQLSAYQELMPNNIADEEETEDFEVDEDIPNDVQNMLQLCNIIYPTGNTRRCFGRKGFDECFAKSKTGRGVKFEYRTQDQFLEYDTIRDYAPKLKRIIDYVTNAEGIVFIYSQYYYSGIIPLALALEHVGFNKLGGNLGDKVKVTQKAKLINGKRPNYIILSRDSDLSPNNDKEIAITKSIENKEGDNVKVVIVSKIGTEGLDFKNIREMHLLDPWYNLNRAEQIIGRGVRTCSHINLPKEKRNTSVYMHAVTMPNKKEESVDLRVYRIAEKKQNNIKLVENVLKASAIDCSFNKPNLYFSKSKLKISFDIITSQGVKLKGYKVGDNTDETLSCMYEKKGSSTDDSTYDIELIRDEIDVYKKYVSSIFRGVDRYTYSEIVEMLKDSYKSIDEDVLKYALTDMLEEPYYFAGYKSKRGHLIYAGQKYIFTTNSLSSNMSHKARLPLDALREHQQTNTRVEKSTEKKNIDIADVSTIDVVKWIEEEVNKIEKYVNRQYHSQILEGVIDRLSSQQLVSLIDFLNSSEEHSLKEQIRDSIDNAGFTHEDNGKITLFYNHTENDFFCKKGSTFGKCTALDLSKVVRQVNDIKTRLFTDHDEKVKGFVAHKNGVAKFKVRDGNTSGYVCAQTHSLQVDDLKKRITDIDPNAFDAKAKLSKPKLCDVYEALLRTKGVIKRPFKKHQVSK